MEFAFCLLACLLALLSGYWVGLNGACREEKNGRGRRRGKGRVGGLDALMVRKVFRRGYYFRQREEKGREEKRDRASKYGATTC